MVDSPDNPGLGGLELMHDNRSYHDVKRSILGSAGLLAGHDMPEATVVMVQAGGGEDYQADKIPDQLRAMADCMERYTAEKVSELRKLADSIERSPDK
jgi:hypothetical protein